jgi:hypothetical protein
MAVLPLPLYDVPSHCHEIMVFFVCKEGGTEVKVPQDHDFVFWRNGDAAVQEGDAFDAELFAYLGSRGPALLT